MTDDAIAAEPQGFVARWSKALLAVILFVIAVRTLGAAADALSPTLEDWFESVIDKPLSALGAGWLVTYLLANGSAVAGLAVTLVSSEAVEPARGFLLLAGSRLGAAAFIVLLGVLQYLRARPRPPLLRALGLGFLTFVVALTVYLPATALGYALFDPVHEVLLEELPVDLEVDALTRTGDLADDLVDLVGAVPVALVALAMAVVSLQLFDGFLAGIDEEKLRDRCRVWLRHGWISFASGLVLTALTTSVALSVGALVPLFSRGLVKTREMIPYLLGAGLGTMADTVLVAFLLGSKSSLAVVLVLVLSAAVVTAAYLFRFGGYSRFVERTFRIFTARPTGAVGFALLLVAVPVLLFWLG